MASAGQVLWPKERSVHVITTLDALKQDKSARMNVSHYLRWNRKALNQSTNFAEE